MARRCTDVIFIVLAFVAGLGLSSIWQYAEKHGDYRKLFHGYNVDGELCGVSPRVALRPLLYFCPDSSAKEGVSLKKPVCVSSCPESRALVWECGDFGYKATAVAGRYCLPTDEALLKHITEKVSSNDVYDFAQKVSELPNAWLALAAAAAIAFVFGYIYLMLLETCAGALVWVCLLVVVAAPSSAGAYLIWVAKFEGGWDGIPHAGNDEDNFAIGVGLAAAGAILFAIVSCSAHSIETAIETVKVSADCLSDAPSLLLSPLIELLSKAATLTAMMVGFLLLLSCGEVTFGKGIYRTLEYTDNEKAYLAHFAVMFIWAAEFFSSLSQFAVAWCVKKWYFTPYEGDRKHATFLGLPRGYLVGLVYHLGSLLFGSLLIALFRFVRIVLQVVASRSRKEGTEIGTIISRVLSCAVACFDRLIVFINKNAYIEMAISSTPFCTSAQRAIQILGSEFVAAGILNGATYIIQIAGTGAITCGGAAVTWIMCTRVAPFNDEGSQHYVSDPAFVTGASAVICLIVSLAFVVVFDTVSDTILFCLATEHMESGRDKLLESDRAQRGRGGPDRRERGLQIVAADESDAEGGPSSRYAPPSALMLVREHRSMT